MKLCQSKQADLLFSASLQSNGSLLYQVATETGLFSLKDIQCANPILGSSAHCEQQPKKLDHKSNCSATGLSPCYPPYPPNSIFPNTVHKHGQGRGRTSSFENILHSDSPYGFIKESFISFKTRYIHLQFQI